jgi:hypothetical protein
MRRRKLAPIWEVAPMQDSDKIVIRCGTREELTLTGVRFKSREDKLHRALELCDLLNGVAGESRNDHATITSPDDKIVRETIPIMNIIQKLGVIINETLGDPTAATVLTSTDVVGTIVHGHESDFFKKIGDYFNVEISTMEQPLILTMNLDQLVAYLNGKRHEHG